MTTKIKAIIIDDEERARRVLANMLEEFCPEIELVGSYKNVPQGVIGINKNNPNVVFLDIEMPDYSGFELLDFFKNIDFEIVFVTAYNKYALRAFEVSAIDYILKPVRIDQLENTINKLKQRVYLTTIQDRLETLKTNLNSDGIKKIAIPVATGLLFVKTNEISHINADGSYAELWLKDGSKILVSKKLKYFEELLINQSNFYRTHRSHIVNLNFIAKYSRHESLLILENKQIVKVSRDQKVELENILKK